MEGECSEDRSVEGRRVRWVDGESKEGEKRG